MSENTATELRYFPDYRLGDYDIRRFLGSGAAADVYLARHRTLENDVGLKVIRARAAERWRDQEAKTICRLRHPNIISVHSVDRIEGRPVLVMDLVEGKTLQKVLREQGSLELDKALRIVCSITSVLECVHPFATESSSSQAHLALNPSNIFLDRAGTVRIGDFGIAQAIGGGISSPGDVGSSPWYVAPEQYEGRPSVQSDLWAVGALLFEMLLGKAPFQQGSLEECRESICGPDPEFGLDFANLPAPIRGVIDRCLRRDLERRFASAAELASGLAEACLALGLVKCSRCGEDLPPASDVCPECIFADLRKSLSQRGHGSPRRSGPAVPATGYRRLTVLVLLAIAVLASAGYWLWRSAPEGTAARRKTMEPPGRRTVPMPRQPEAPAAIDGARRQTLADSIGAPPRAITAATREWENVRSLEKAPGGTYEERIERIRKFIASYPDSAEARDAQEQLRVWENERWAFLETEEFERRADSKMCAILAAWQGFLARQTTELCRSHALSCIGYWKGRIENYSGYAELTIRSARGLPLADDYLLYKGKPEPYFVLFSGDKVIYRSRTIENNTSPSWDEKVRIYLLPGTRLDLQIWDEDLFGSRLLLQLPLMPLPVDGPFQVSSGSVLVNADIMRDR